MLWRKKKKRIKTTVLYAHAQNYSHFLNAALKKEHF